MFFGLKLLIVFFIALVQVASKDSLVGETRLKVCSDSGRGEFRVLNERQNALRNHVYISQSRTAGVQRKKECLSIQLQA